MILRILRPFNRSYPYLVLGGYLVAFVLAFICVFSFPLGALVLVIGSVLSLAVVVFLGETLRGLEGILSRRALKKNRCPACRMGPIQKSSVGHKCLGCAGTFDLDGWQVVETLDEVDASNSKRVAVNKSLVVE